ncbi:hepatitis A virus cellular receptor 1 homolog [Cricetulus griseus]|uniref:hepatitis A virus cellular receptor 1 homolog n=1 Tax=Cricetulus griseus TaxID=10029 RepID=UPI00022F60B0|nr:hepatitis A virus cellular receptor 1 homolog [Cricetulus griseus]
MMLPQVFISGLLLLLPGAVDSYTVVKAVPGDPVTLPCTYSTFRGVYNICWGRGQCPSFNCVNTLIWTNGNSVVYQRSSRYQLKGNISGGNVSLTIENVIQSDSGLYCCRVEVPGWFNDLKVTFSLEVKPEIPTSLPTSPTTTRPTATERPKTTGRATTTVKPKTMSTRPTHVPTSPTVSTSTSTTPAQTQTHTPEPTTFDPYQTTDEVTETPSYTLPADCNDTVTSSDNSWNNYTESIPSGKQQKKMTKSFYIGISIAALLLSLLVCIVAIISYILMKKKSGSLSLVAFRISKVGSLGNTADGQSRAEDNVYIIEDSPYPQESVSWAP